ncbi:hypothetical protein [Actinospica robiniae]|uniref:hypothetical protein n=1 Tax=Actinospica robiniae TaxID=304901 RepID=UPI00040310D5|nr:hypothetical protein [Actinospica robiniae]
MPVADLTRYRAVLVSIAVLGTALAGAIAPASAAATGAERPDHLANGLFTCSTDPSAPAYVAFGVSGADSGIDLEGVPRDTDTTDYPTPTAQYQLWPVSDPTQITTYAAAEALAGFEAPVNVPMSSLVEGQTYAWQARTVAGSDTSPWTHTCYFSLDTTPPSAAPTITSANYPSNGGWDQGGAPMQVTFGADEVGDVAGYGFSWEEPIPVPRLGGTGAYGILQKTNPWADTDSFVQAPTVGGSASLDLLPPAGAYGPLTLYVESFDRAFNASSVTSYQVFVSSTEPTITPPATTPAFDKKASFTFTPNATAEAASPIVSYTVTIGAGAAHTYKADPDGSATVSLKLDQPANDDVTVTSTSANGWVSDAAEQNYYYDTTPTVSSDVYPENGFGGGVGVPGTFTFAPKVAGVVSYTYSFDYGNTETTVPADANGDAQITWAPTGDSGLPFYDLTVYATTKDGVNLTSYDYSFMVN